MLFVLSFFMSKKKIQNYIRRTKQWQNQSLKKWVVHTKYRAITLYLGSHYPQKKRYLSVYEDSDTDTHGISSNIIRYCI